MTDEPTLGDRGAVPHQPTRGTHSIPRVMSLLVLVGVLVFTALLFFKVMALFVVPLFLACVLVVVFGPVFDWFCHKLEGRTSLAALSTTVVILLSVLVPCGLLGWLAYAEIEELIPEKAATAEVRADAAQAVEPTPAGVLGTDFDNLEEGSRLAWFAKWYHSLSRRKLDNAEVGRLIDMAAVKARAEGPHSVLVGLQAVAAFGLGLVVMLVSIYYFFADGPAMINALMHFSPLDDVYEQELLERFAQVSRAMFVATLLSAVVQGLLAGIGYWLAVPPGWPVFLLTVLTMVLAMVPFIGSLAVWAPVAIWLFVQGHTAAAIGLAVYCAAIVSTADNLIKPWVLHGQSNLHPLLALLSVLGGVTVLGPIGILVGPMLVAFLQALLTMLRKELDSLEQDAAAEHAASTPDASPVGASVEARQDSSPSSDRGKRKRRRK